MLIVWHTDTVPILYSNEPWARPVHQSKIFLPYSTIRRCHYLLVFVIHITRNDFTMMIFSICIKILAQKPRFIKGCVRACITESNVWNTNHIVKSVFCLFRFITSHELRIDTVDSFLYPFFISYKIREDISIYIKKTDIVWLLLLEFFFW